MFKTNLGVIPTTPLELNEVGIPVDAIIVDQFYSQDFNRGENGFARSDIESFIHAESDELRQVIAQRLYEVKSQYPDQNLSDEDLLKMVVPRNVQSFHDFREWNASIRNDGFEKSVNAWREQKLKEQEQRDTINFSDTSVPDVAKES